MDHGSASDFSRNSCESLFDQLGQRLHVQYGENQNRMCPIRADDRTLCYVDHFKRKDKIKIWLPVDYLRLNEFQPIAKYAGITAVPRKKIGKGWGRAWPIFVEPSTGAELASAVDVVLLADSFRAVGKRAREVNQSTNQSPNSSKSARALFPEGAYRTLEFNVFERNPRARDECIRIFGAVCAVCNMNFKDRYGSDGEGFIHVHHLIPLSEIRGERVIDPGVDLRPVCPNCHAMIHLRRPPHSIEEMKEMLVA